jgi:hypothetical protein
MSYESRLSAVVLRRGSIWKPDPFNEPPYLMADPMRPWPDGADCTATFYNSAGETLLEVDCDVTPQTIQPLAAAVDVDTVPAGADFEIVVQTDDGPEQVRYGKVLRREAEFLNAPAATASYQALQFTDNFPTLGLRSSWKAVSGKTQVFDNSGSSLPNSVGAKTGFLFLGAAQSAIRWFAPLNGDSVRVGVNLLNQGTGKTTVVICSDILMTSYLGVQFEENAHSIHLCTGTGPLAVTYRGSAITNTVADGDNYTIAYTQSTKTLSVYKGTGTTPLGSWTDSTNIVPHGPGYRYAGLNWISGNGVQVSYWSAKDDV